MRTARGAAPRFACHLLAGVLPATVAGRSTLGDLIEEYHRRSPGPLRRIWFWGVALDLIVRYLPDRIGGASGGFGRDLVYATRLARRYPALVLAALLSLSLAIGVSTAAFSVVNSHWLRAELVADPSVVAVWRTHKNGASMAWPASEFFELRERARLVTLDAWLQTTQRVATTSDAADGDRAPVSFVTGDYLPNFAPAAAAGRLLGSGDDVAGAGPVIVLDDLYWRRHLGGDRSVIGRPLRIAGVPFTVVGVAGRDFIDPSRWQPAMWAPLAALDRLPPDVGGPAATRQLFVIGRLRAQIGVMQAKAELSGLAGGLPPPGGSGTRPATGAEPGAVVSTSEAADNRIVLISTAAVIALVLVLACANVSNLQLAGAAARRQEIAVRLACGAGRRRVARQFLTESVLLSATSGAVGLLLARWLSPALAAGMDMPGSDVDPDLRVYGFVCVATVVSAIGTGIASAYYGARSDVSTSLKGTTSRDGAQTRPGRARSIFIGIQAAASIVLVSLAALQVRALVSLAWLNPGFDVQNVLGVGASFPFTPEGQARARAFWDLAVTRIRSMPGVERATLANFVPFDTSFGDPDQVRYNGTDADYFATLGMRVVRGRTYDAGEVAAHARVAVINERLARQAWGLEDPVGTSASRVDKRYEGIQVIGVVADVFDRVHQQRTSMIFRPHTPDYVTSLAVRTADPRAMAGVIQDAVTALAPDARPSVSIVEERYAREFERPRRYAVLAASVGVFALLLSVVGLLGVTSFAVRTRTREIGIRIALGARGGDVVGLLVRDGMRPVIIGLAFGLGAALLGGRMVAGLLYGLSARDPLALTAAVAILLMAAFIAIFLPTRRATGLDPAMVLRDV